MTEHITPTLDEAKIIAEAKGEAARILAKAEGFPHEIGVFLDYPLEDVVGFIENAGQNYKCSGCWKVYCNECETRKLFAKYKKCREVYRRLWSQGRDIRTLTVAS